jgi:tetratricopeptide (TPR) repeat protein
MKRVLAFLIILGLVGTGLSPVRAQDFRECQSLFEEVLREFNRAYEENEPRILQSVIYRRKLVELQKAYKAYHQAAYNPADSTQKLTNEAVLNALTGNYSKSIRLLSSLDSLGAQGSYYLGLFYLLNQEYSRANSLLMGNTFSRAASLNTLVTFGAEKRLTEAIQYGVSEPHANYKGKWNYNLGLLYKQNQQLDESVGEVSSAIRQGDQMTYRLLRGDVLMRLGKSKNAVSDFEKVARKYPKAQIRYANALVALKRYQEAEVTFLEYLDGEDRGFRKDAILGLGHVYYGLNQLDNAQKYYRLAATMIKDSPVALCGQANVLLTKRAYTQAKTLYDRILSTDSSYVSAYLGRGIAWYGLGEYKKALTDFEKSKILFDENDRSIADVFVCRGYAYYYTGRPAEALADFETAVRMDGTRYEALAGISSVMIDQRSFSAAGQYLSRALNYEKKYDLMWSNYGNLLLHFDMFKKGYDVFRKAIALNPSNLKAQNGWGIVLLESDHLNESKVLFDSLVKENPDVPYLLNNRGIVNAYHGNRYDQKKDPAAADQQYQLAFDDFKEAMAVAPSRKFYNVNQGNVYRYWQKYDEAKLSYQTYQDKSALNNTAVLYAGLENMKDAKYYLGVALQLDSAHHVFQFNMNLLMKGKQKEFARSLARATASADEESAFSDIGIKYSRDGFVTIYLYDYEYDTLHFPGRHYLPLPVQEYEEEFFIPEYDFSLLPYTPLKAPKIKEKKTRYKAQKVRMRKRGRRTGTECPVF